MNGQNSSIPFGLMYEESAPRPEQLAVPVYDEAADLSYIRAPDGRRVPYVESAGVTGTETVTMIEEERTGEAECWLNQIAGTETVTKARSETTDVLPEAAASDRTTICATQTLTRVRSETTDDDHQDGQGSSSVRGHVLGTETFTEVAAEPTDSDATAGNTCFEPQ